MNFLYLTHRVPYPPDKGDRIRNWNVLKYLSGRGRVWLGTLADELVPDSTRTKLAESCADVAVVPVNRSRWFRAGVSLLAGRSISEGAFQSATLAATVDRWASQVSFDAVVVSASSLASFQRRDSIRQIPAIIDLVDVDSQKWLDYSARANWPRSWLYRIEGNRLRKLERELPTWARGVLVVSVAETELYRQFAASGPIVTATNGTDFDYFQPMTLAEDPACVFVGALDYRPNIDAAVWFAKEVWPEIMRRRPEATFRLVGRQPTDEVKQLAMIPGVELIGQVPDVRPWLARSAVAVTPLRIARGVQNKVLEALAMGRAVVSSPAALAGLAAVPNQHLISAMTPSEWVEAVMTLLDDAEKRHDLGRAGREYVLANHSWDRCLAPLGDLLKNGLGTPRVGPK